MARRTELWLRDCRWAAHSASPFRERPHGTHSCFRHANRRAASGVSAPTSPRCPATAGAGVSALSPDAGSAALPAGANVYLIAQMYGIGVGRATNAVVISTAASVFTLSIALLLLGVKGT